MSSDFRQLETKKVKKKIWMHKAVKGLSTNQIMSFPSVKIKLLP